MSDETTLLLRKLLDERGVEFATDDFDLLLTTSWQINDVFAKYLESIGDYVDEDDPTMKLKMNNVTPEQAIAVTLGSGMCSMEYGGDVTDSTKRVLDVYFCSECGSPTYNDCMPYYCMYCGKAVKR